MTCSVTLKTSSKVLTWKAVVGLGKARWIFRNVLFLFVPSPLNVQLSVLLQIAKRPSTGVYVVNAFVMSCETANFCIVRVTLMGKLF